MKMTKLLASGVAAALATTSLAAIGASAAERSFEMGHTQGTIKLTAKSGMELGDQYLLTEDQITAGATLGVSDGSIVLHANGKDADKVTGVTLSVTGVKGTRSSSSRTYNYNFTSYYDEGCSSQNYGGDGPYFKLDIHEKVGPVDSFVPAQFVEITKIELTVNGEKTVETAKEYDAWGSSDWGSYNGATMDPVWGSCSAFWQSGQLGKDIQEKLLSGDYGFWGFNYASEKSTVDLYPFMSITDGYDATARWQEKNRYPYKDIDTGDYTSEQYSSYVKADGSFVENPKNPDYIEGSFFEDATWNAKASSCAKDGTIVRNEIRVLSWSDSYTAVNGGNYGSGVDGNQTYEDADYNKGTNPKDFAGLASQVGDFFNKQTNGTITFTFTTSSGNSGTAWNNGGVPSSQVGIKNALGDATANDFVLAFNNSQTGSLQAVASVDAAAGEVTFDISDVLDALDGKTIGVIDNIYYGMTKGVTYTGDHPYSGQTGFEVQKITFSYDEDEDAGNDIEEDDDDTDDDDDDDDDMVDDDDDDDDDDVDDDDDTDDDDDDDDDDGVVVDDDEPSNGNQVDGTQNAVVTPGADENPNTGVALAVVPAMVAAAAAVVSKKRK